MACMRSAVIGRPAEWCVGASRLDSTRADAPLRARSNVPSGRSRWHSELVEDAWLACEAPSLDGPRNGASARVGLTAPYGTHHCARGRMSPLAVFGGFPNWWKTHGLHMKRRHWTARGMVRRRE